MDNSTQTPPVPSNQTLEGNPTFPQVDPAMNRLALFMLAGVFVLMVLGGILIAAGPKKDPKNEADLPQLIEQPSSVSSGTALPPAAYDISEVPGANIAPSEVSKASFVQLSSDNLAFDVNNDRKLSVLDLIAVGSFVDSHQYAAIYDFNSDNFVNVQDLAEIRSVYESYPAAEYDINNDGKLDVTDIVAAASFIDTHQYAAIYDFNSDNAVDVLDLAKIRTAVALAGTASQ